MSELGINCTEVDAMLQGGRRLLEGHDIAYGGVLAVAALISLAVWARGERLALPLAVTIACAGGALVSYVMSATVGASCTVRLAGAAGVALVCATTAACLLRSGIVLAAAAGLGAIGHFGYEALGVAPTAAPFAVAGLSGYYVMAVGGCGAVGGVVGCVRRRLLLQLASAALGACGIVAVVASGTARADAPVPGPVAFFLVLVIAPVGAWLQRRERLRTRRTSTPPSNGDHALGHIALGSRASNC